MALSDLARRVGQWRLSQLFRKVFAESARVFMARGPYWLNRRIPVNPLGIYLTSILEPTHFSAIILQIINTYVK